MINSEAHITPQTQGDTKAAELTLQLCHYSSFSVSQPASHVTLQLSSLVFSSPPFLSVHLLSSSPSDFLPPAPLLQPLAPFQYRLCIFRLLSGQQLHRTAADRGSTAHLSLVRNKPETQSSSRFPRDVNK